MKKLMMAAMVAAAALTGLADKWGFTYQAELRDEKGVKPITGSQTVEIRLWDAPTGGDVPLWGRVYNVLADTNGLFNVAVSDDAGSVVTELMAKDMPTLASVFSSHDAGSVYIGLTVKDSAGEIVPRQCLYAVPFADTANAARSLVGDTVTVAGALKLDDNTSFSKSGITLADSSISTMGYVSAKRVTTSGKLTANGGVSASNIEFSGTLKQKGEEVVPVPIGGIILWNKKTPPDGSSWDIRGRSDHWAICNGRNEAPDLSGRFIVGVGNGGTGTNYTLGQAGGSETVTLTTAQMPAHRHKYVSDDGLNGINDAYAHCTSSCKYNQDFDSTTRKGNHLGDYQNEIVGGDANGNTVAHENRPPFYALYYIMRVR